ncbi:glycosyltransferase family 2 protein [candidate division KSB1 bacterium]
MNPGRTLIFHSCRREQFLSIITREKEKRPEGALTPLLLPGMEFDPGTGPPTEEPIYLPAGSDRYGPSGVDADFYKMIAALRFNRIVVPLNNPAGAGYGPVLKLAFKLNIKKIFTVDPDLHEGRLPPVLSLYLLNAVLIRVVYFSLSLATLIITPLLIGLAVIILGRGRKNLVRPVAPPVSLDPLGTEFTVSAVIPTTGAVHKLTPLIEGLRRQSRPPDELLLVMPAEAESGHLNDLLGRRDDPAVKIIPSPLGLTLQKNRGAEAASGNILIFFDDDIIPEKKFVEELIRVFADDRDGRIAGAAGFICNRSAKRRPLIALIEKSFFLPGPGDGRFRKSGFPTWPDESAAETPVEFLPGGLTAYRREVVEAFGFDENLPGYGYLEDADFSFRTSRRFRHMFVPAARCLHLSSPRGRRERRLLAAMLVRHHTRLAAGNLPAGPVAALAFGLSICGLLLRALVCLDPDSARGVGAGIMDTLRGKST